MLLKDHVVEEITDRLIQMLQDDHRAASISRTDRAMLDFAAQLTRQPNSINKGQIDVLRQFGFDDRAIHDIVCVTAYFAFVNRVADGLGVELEN